MANRFPTSVRSSLLFAGFLLALQAHPSSAKAQDRQDPPAFRAATTVQQPTFGVSIDAAGVLKMARFAPPGSPINRQRIAQARVNLPKDCAAPSKLRKISLKRLSDAIQAKLRDGQTPDESMSHLAGLIQVNYVFVLPDENDIVLAGPAEGWLDDVSGRTVGLSTGWPTIQLQDLVTAFGVFHPSSPTNTWVGCSIEPTPDSMTKLVQFNRSIPSAVSMRQRGPIAQQVVHGTREALGLANIRVFNLPPASHMAQIMIEADYRMKLIALGLESPPIPMQTFFSRLQNAPRSKVQRWWFEPSKHSVRLSNDGASLAFVGVGVDLSSEDYAIDSNGGLYPTGKKSSGPATAYAKTFSEKYADIAAASPVFKQLRNMVDLLVLSAHAQSLNDANKLDFSKSIFWNVPASLIEKNATPKKVPCVVNAKWSSSRLLAASGGVSITPRDLLSADRVLHDDKDLLSPMRDDVAGECLQQTHWWWD